jgi:hypothetical protein
MDQLFKILETHADQIGEFVESVRIFVTAPSEGHGGDLMLTVSRGSIYATRGAVQEWLTKIEEGDREDVRECRALTCNCPECEDNENDADDSESDGQE